MDTQKLSLLVLGAHPDDAEFHAGGLATRYRDLGHAVKLVSVTDGGAGHHERARDELIVMRKQEAADAGKVIGAPYEVWGFPDGELMPSLEVRNRIIQEVREFRPDLVLTHRTCDYHPDHRAVGQAVQDASYMVTVPRILPDIPALRSDPVVAYLPDLFTKPYPLQVDAVIDISDQVTSIAKMLACQRSQVFEWLPYEEGILAQVPEDENEKLEWVTGWYAKHIRPRVDRLLDGWVWAGEKPSFIEAFEISEYARQPSRSEMPHLFPGLLESQK